MVDAKQIETVLADANTIVSQISPLVGVIEGLVTLAIATAKKIGQDTTTFEAAWAEYQGKRTDLAGAVDAFYAKYPEATTLTATPTPGTTGE